MENRQEKQTLVPSSPKAPALETEGQDGRPQAQAGGRMTEPAVMTRFRQSS
jgi:hypothetical protein